MYAELKVCLAKPAERKERALFVLNIPENAFLKLINLRRGKVSLMFRHKLDVLHGQQFVKND